MRTLLFSALFVLLGMSSLQAQVGFQWGLYTAPEQQPIFMQQPVELNLPVATTYPGFDILINIRGFDLLRGPIQAARTSLMLPGTSPEPFFCRIEWLTEQQLSFPIRIRLGEIDYVDRLEGKGIGF